MNSFSRHSLKASYSVVVQVYMWVLVGAYFLFIKPITLVFLAPCLPVELPKLPLLQRSMCSDCYTIEPGPLVLWSGCRFGTL